MHTGNLVKYRTQWMKKMQTEQPVLNALGHTHTHTHAWHSYAHNTQSKRCNCEHKVQLTKDVQNYNSFAEH